MCVRMCVYMNGLLSGVCVCVVSILRTRSVCVGFVVEGQA